MEVSIQDSRWHIKRRRYAKRSRPSAEQPGDPEPCATTVYARGSADTPHTAVGMLIAIALRPVGGATVFPDGHTPASMHVLLGLEGSDESVETLETTIERVLETGDDLLVAVVDKPEASRSPSAVVDLAKARLEEAGIDAEVRQLEGDPGSELVDLAEREGVDQLVIGGGTRSPMGKVRLGPVTEFVLLNATTTVKLVR